MDYAPITVLRGIRGREIARKNEIIRSISLSPQLQKFCNLIKIFEQRLRRKSETFAILTRQDRSVRRRLVEIPFLLPLFEAVGLFDETLGFLSPLKKPSISSKSSAETPRCARCSPIPFGISVLSFSRDLGCVFFLLFLFTLHLYHSRISSMLVCESDL
jgi:hypothetical protein